METILQKKLSIDKTKWTPVKFGEVVFEPKESSKDPVKDGIKHVVGLEHIESENIHLRKSETLEESTTFTKKFAIGDVLFGRRRAYLRKASQASFNGICSGDITVFRAKENLMPELLPFVVNNEKFFDYAIKHSAGGLSPRVKFKDLANYEFLLPPKDQQAQLAKLLWAMDEVIEKEKILKLKYHTFYKRCLFDSVSGFNSDKIDTWKDFVLGDLGESFGGLTGKTKKDFGTGAPFVNYMNVFTNSKVDFKQVDYVTIKDGEKQHELKYGDILLTGSSETPEDIGMSSVVLDDIKGCFLNSFCFGIRLKNFDNLLPEYARYLLRGKGVRSFMFKHAQGSTRFNLSKTTVKQKLKFLLPTINEQHEIVKKLDFMDEQVNEHDRKNETSLSLQKSLINQIF